MRCAFAHDDGAYVLGALSPADRLDFERHLAGCKQCTRAVGELAGLPGLLGRVDPTVLDGPPPEEPLPATLLPALSRAVRRTRSRRTRVAAGFAAMASVAAVVVAVVAWQVGGNGSPLDDPGASASPSGLVARTMEPVGEVPVRASLTLEEVAWGTRLGLVCTYDRDAVEYQLPSEVDYTLFVRTRDGRAEQVGSWRSASGTTTRLTAATAATRADIDSVEVRTPDGRVVLRISV